MRASELHLLLVGLKPDAWSGGVPQGSNIFHDIHEGGIVDVAFAGKDGAGTCLYFRMTDVDEDDVESLGEVSALLAGLIAEGRNAARPAAPVRHRRSWNPKPQITAEDVERLAPYIPEESAAAVLLVDLRWVALAREVILRSGGILLYEKAVSPVVLTLPVAHQTGSEPHSRPTRRQ